MARWPAVDDGFRCGRYPAAWAGRTVHGKANSSRFEIVAEAATSNTNAPAEALRLARLYADTGSAVTVRDRSRRRGYLSETELEGICHE